MSFRILIADDHTLVRQGLKALLDAQPDMQVVGEVGDGRSTIRAAGELTPDVIIMDISMPDMNGIDATRQLLAGPRKVKVLGLSMHADPRFVARLLRAGASGYLLKDCAFEELARAIRVVMDGQVYLSPGIAGSVVQDYLRQTPGDAPPGSPLTDREREVLQLLAEGRSTKQIAATLQLSPKTVETHRRRIMDKLSVYSVAELTRYAIREGLIGLEG